MKDPRRTVICGDSIYMLAIESGLSAVTGGDVIRIHPNLPNITDRIKALEPRAVIIERTGKNSQIAMNLLEQGIPVVVLDEAQRSVLVLSNDESPKTRIHQLTSIIERINQQHEFDSGEKLSRPDEP